MNQVTRAKRHRALRHKVSGTGMRPRVSVYRSLRRLYVQVIDDALGRTLFGVIDAPAVGQSQLERASQLGVTVGQWLLKHNFQQAVFDRGGFKYHGRVKTVADGIRKAGITI